MQNNNKINLDAQELTITKGGTSDFFYPISRKTHIDFSADLMKSYTDIISNHCEHSDIDLYKIFAKYFISEAVAVFQGELLKKEISNKSYSYNIPEEWRVWPALFNNQVPQTPKYITDFIKGPPTPEYSKKIFSLNFAKRLTKVLTLKRGGVNIDGLKVKPITNNVLNKNIIATQRTPLIIEHAQEVNEDVIFRRSDKWFNPIDNNIILPYELSQIDIDLLDATQEILSRYNLEFSDHIKQYLINIIKESIAPFKVHSDALAKMDNLPRTLWIGTSGNIWDCLLKLAVRQKGGYVCGHDHGTGQAHITTPLMGLIELWGSDEFYTFTDNLAGAVPDWSLMDEKSVLITSPKNKKSISYDSNRENKNGSVFLLSTVYDKDRGRMNPLMPDIPQIDWQTRLVSFLKDKSYDVTIKSHPESSFPVPKTFETELGAKINSDRFGEVYEHADMFIFDYICTSTFKDALKTNIPIIIINFGDVEWTDKAYSLIIKRCSFIKGYYDDDNRLQVAWGEFDNSADEAIKKASNSEFYNEYYY